jgi:hypothetical protein
MKNSNLANIPLDELVERFVAIGIELDEALLGNEVREFNRLFQLKTAIVDELRSRTGDQRQVLLNLYDHPNAQVRLNAVKATLAIAPDVARRKLQEIAESGEFPQAGDAGMSIINLDRGIYKPA